MGGVRGGSDGATGAVASFFPSLLTLGAAELHATAARPASVWLKLRLPTDSR